MAEAILYQLGVGETGKYVVVSILLIYSIYEDTRSVNRTQEPESILIVMWTCTFFLTCAKLLIQGLEKVNLVKFEEVGPIIVGRPKHTIANVPRSGNEFFDGMTLVLCYYLYWFYVVVKFRSLVSQFRFVKQLFEENQVW
jgi:hypothetical protein